MIKRAVITGITGQDGSYLAELLLDKGYEVHGLIRRSSTFNTSRIDHLYRDPHEPDARLFLHYADLGDGTRLATLLKRIDPVEVYHLGAQSHVRVSFDEPVHTGDTTGWARRAYSRRFARRRSIPASIKLPRPRCSAPRLRRRTRPRRCNRDRHTARRRFTRTG